MEVGQGPNWAVAPKEKKNLIATFPELVAIPRYLCRQSLDCGNVHCIKRIMV
jgi:hypothetical protein